MLFDLNALAGQARYRDEKFMRVWCEFVPTDLPQAWAWELAVLLRTPGFGIDHLRTAFRWKPFVVFESIPEILEYFRDDEWNIVAAAEANFKSVTLDDGVDWLHAIREMRPNYTGSVPLCVSQSLRQMRANGHGVADIAAKFDLPTQAIHKFLREDRFDPFTGLDMRCPSYFAKLLP